MRTIIFLIFLTAPVAAQDIADIQFAPIDSPREINTAETRSACLESMVGHDRLTHQTIEATSTLMNLLERLDLTANELQALQQYMIEVLDAHDDLSEAITATCRDLL